MADEQIHALSAHKITGATLVESGNTAVFAFENEHGAPFNVSIPSDQLAHMLYLTSVANMQSQAKNGLTADQVTSYPIERWEIGTATDNPSLVLLSFRIMGGGALAFRIHRDAAKRYRDVLTSLLEHRSTTPDHSSKSKH